MNMVKEIKLFDASEFETDTPYCLTLFDAGCATAVKLPLKTAFPPIVRVPEALMLPNTCSFSVAVPLPILTLPPVSWMLTVLDEEPLLIYQSAVAP